MALLCGPLGEVHFADTRPLHKQLFEQICPQGHEYYAGHYRGENYRCLQYYEVGVRADPRVGYPPHSVAAEMEALAKIIHDEIAVLGAASKLPLTKGERLISAVALACRVFVLFLTIHPYANGNGHIARMLLVGLLARQGYRLKEFPIDPRPVDPPYSELIKAYRDGNIEPFERYILAQII